MWADPQVAFPTIQKAISAYAEENKFGTVPPSHRQAHPEERLSRLLRREENVLETQELYERPANAR